MSTFQSRIHNDTCLWIGEVSTTFKHASMLCFLPHYTFYRAILDDMCVVWTDQTAQYQQKIIYP